MNGRLNRLVLLVSFSAVAVLLAEGEPAYAEPQMDWQPPPFELADAIDELQP